MSSIVSVCLNGWPVEVDVELELDEALTLDDELLLELIEELGLEDVAVEDELELVLEVDVVEVVVELVAR